MKKLSPGGKTGVLGFFGHQNVGDDAFEEIHKEIFPKTRSVISANLNDETGLTNVVLGGGNVILPYYLDRLPEPTTYKHLYLVSVALPYSEKDAEILGSVSDKIRFAWMRHEQDTNVLNEMGINASFHHDMVYSWDVNEPKVTYSDVKKLCTLPSIHRAPKDRSIVISLADTYWARDGERRDDYDAALDQMAEFVEAMLPKFNIIFLPFYHYYGGRDTAVHLDVVRRCSKRWLIDVIDQYVDPRTAYAIISQVADVVVSSKFHGMVYGIKAGKPSISFGKTKKVSAMMRDLDLSDLAVNFGKVPDGTLVKKLIHATSDPTMERISQASQLAQASAQEGFNRLAEAFRDNR